MVSGGKEMPEVKMSVELLASTPEPEKLIERAGRICYASECKEETRDQFIKSRIKQGHESIIEHASASFYINNISRACSHQLVRHRLASFSQQSQRYVNESDFDYIIPPSMEDDERVKIYFKDCMDYRQRDYKIFQDCNIKPEDARFILPNACATRLIMTANFREWRHFLKMRLDSHAQWEIRKLAELILDELYRISPAVFIDIYSEHKK